MKSDYVWMNGVLVDFEKANIHFNTPGLHYGIGVFEGIRCYAGEKGAAVFRLKEHINRLFDSAKILGFRELRYSEDELAEAVKTTIRANKFTECYVRPLIYLTDGGWNLNIDTGKAAFGISVWEWTQYLGSEALEKGVRANISSFTRHHPNVMMTKAKICGNYANSVLAKTESVRLGFDEAIMLDPEGYVGECTGENIFIVKNGSLLTPDLAPVLGGITREAIIALAGDLGYPVLETPLSRDQLYTADEIFVCGTAAECIALREVDFRIIGKGTMGPITRTIQQAFHSAVRGKHPRSVEWLDCVS